MGPFTESHFYDGELLYKINIYNYYYVYIIEHFCYFQFRYFKAHRSSMNYQMYIWYFNDILYFLTDAYFFQHRYRCYGKFTPKRVKKFHRNILGKN